MDKQADQIPSFVTLQQAAKLLNLPTDIIQRIARSHSGRPLAYPKKRTHQNDCTIPLSGSAGVHHSSPVIRPTKKPVTERSPLGLAAR
jgi:hypothetical protein